MLDLCTYMLNIYSICQFFILPILFYFIYFLINVISYIFIFFVVRLAIFPSPVPHRYKSFLFEVQLTVHLSCSLTHTHLRGKVSKNRKRNIFQRLSWGRGRDWVGNGPGPGLMLGRVFLSAIKREKWNMRDFYGPTKWTLNFMRNFTSYMHACPCVCVCCVF